MSAAAAPAKSRASRATRASQSGPEEVHQFFLLDQARRRGLLLRRREPLRLVQEDQQALLESKLTGPKDEADDARNYLDQLRRSGPGGG